MAATIQNIELPKLARARDTSGNNNHGQIYSGRALEFDGVSDYFTGDGAADFVHSDFTTAFWINPTLDGYTTGPGGRVIWSTHASNNNNILLIVLNGI
jgi:hypothetical protein